MTVIIPPGVVYRELNREMVLLNLDTGAYFGLNEVGTRIWQLLEKGETLAGSAAVLVKEYEVDEEHANGDVKDLVQKLEGKGLVKLNEQ